MQYHTSANLTLILYNSSVSKKLIVSYFRHSVVCFAQFCQRKYKDKAELFVSEQHTAAFHFLMHVLNELGESLGALDLKQRCTDRSVFDIKVQRERFRSIQSSALYSSHGTLMTHTDRSDDPLQVKQA